MAVRIDTVANIPNTNSGPEEWIIWHQALKARYGKKYANLLWIKAWRARGAEMWESLNEANTVELRNYLEKQGITIEQGLADYPADWLDSFTSMFEFAIGVGKWGAIGLAAVLAVPVLLFLYNLAKRPEIIVGAVGARMGRKI